MRGIARGTGAHHTPAVRPPLTFNHVIASLARGVRLGLQQPGAIQSFVPDAVRRSSWGVSAAIGETVTRQRNPVGACVSRAVRLGRDARVPRQARPSRNRMRARGTLLADGSRRRSMRLVLGRARTKPIVRHRGFRRTRDESAGLGGTHTSDVRFRFEPRADRVGVVRRPSIAAVSRAGARDACTGRVRRF